MSSSGGEAAPLPAGGSEAVRLPEEKRGKRPVPVEQQEALSLPEEKVGAVRGAVLGWYRRGHRDLPWRRTRDPYAILVSEVMLQQTQVERVLPKYLAWMERYPMLATLAAAPRAEVIRNWAPLGYNLRAVRLHEIARQAVDQYGGRLPETMEGLLSLKGIGRYTAGAVACFALGQREPVMDTNVRRVLGRIFAEEAPGATENDRVGWALAEAALPGGDEGEGSRGQGVRGPGIRGPGIRGQESGDGDHESGDGDRDRDRGLGDVYDWNQALMDLGATTCVARNPRCPVCPVEEWCSARRLWFAPDAVQLGFGGLGEPHPQPLSRGERGAWEDGLRGQNEGPAAEIDAQEGRRELGLVAERREVYTAGWRAKSGKRTGEELQGQIGQGQVSQRRGRKGGEGERFEGSRRWFRGRIVDALRALPAGGSLGLMELGIRVKEGFAPEEGAWLRELVEALARDGLVEVVGSGGEVRVALPQ